MIQQFIVARDSVVLWRVREDNPRFLWFWEITGFEYPATLILRGECRSALLDEIKQSTTGFEIHWDGNGRADRYKEERLLIRSLHVEVESVQAIEGGLDYYRVCLKAKFVKGNGSGG